MSLTSVSPLIMDWIKEGLRWKYVWQPVYAPLTIPAQGQVQLPQSDFIYTAPEGLALTFGASFDSPHCGIRLNTPQLDTGNIFCVNNIVALGSYSAPWFVEANIPPQTADGIYNILQYKEWAWTDWAELYLINNDTSPHTCFTFAYTLALLQEERPPDATETALKLILAKDLYGLGEDIKKRISQRKVEDFVGVEEIDTLYELKEKKKGVL